MKILSRDFTKREKILLLVLAILIIGCIYYQFVIRSTAETIRTAKAQTEALMQEKDVLDARIIELENMKEEVAAIEESNAASYMGSYNNSKAEMAFLNEVFGESKDYGITFTELSRSGDLVRREFSFSFETEDWKTAEHILSRLSSGKLRLMLDELNCSFREKDQNGPALVSVQGTAVFYETMVGGKADTQLPEDKTETEAVEANEDALYE